MSLRANWDLGDGGAISMPRKTEAQMDTLASGGDLVTGQLYIVTDAQRLAVATSASAYFMTNTHAGAGAGWVAIDEVQWCYEEISLGSITAFGNGTHGNQYRTSYATWTFPRAFYDENWIMSTSFQLQTYSTSGLRQAIVGTNGHHGASNSKTQAFGIQAFRLTTDSNSDTIIAHCKAMGKYDPAA